MKIEYKRMIVWGNYPKPRSSDVPHVLVIQTNKDGSCIAVNSDYEDSFLAGKYFEIVWWDHYEEIPEKKTRPMNRWEMLKFAADNPGLLCRFDTYKAVSISTFVFDCAANRCQITENTGKEPREEDWRPLPEIECD